jgi:hypothetical protein
LLSEDTHAFWDFSYVTMGWGRRRGRTGRTTLLMVEGMRRLCGNFKDELWPEPGHKSPPYIHNQTAVPCINHALQWPLCRVCTSLERFVYQISCPALSLAPHINSHKDRRPSPPYLWKTSSRMPKTINSSKLHICCVVPIWTYYD